MVPQEEQRTPGTSLLELNSSLDTSINCSRDNTSQHGECYPFDDGGVSHMCCFWRETRVILCQIYIYGDVERIADLISQIHLQGIAL